MAQTVKRLPTMRETWVQSLGWEELLEKEMATHSSILAWKIPWTDKPGKQQSMGSQSRTRLSNFTFTFLYHCLANIWECSHQATRQPQTIQLEGDHQAGPYVGVLVTAPTELLADSWHQSPDL